MVKVGTSHIRQRGSLGELWHSGDLIRSIAQEIVFDKGGVSMKTLTVVLLFMAAVAAMAKDKRIVQVEVISARTQHYVTVLHDESGAQKKHHLQVDLEIKMPDGTSVRAHCRRDTGIWSSLTSCVEPSPGKYDAMIEKHSLHLLIPVPLTYQKMLALTVDGMGKCESIDTISSKVVPILSKTIPKYAGTASDESVIALIDVVVRRVEALHSAHSDGCYYYLFPNENGAPLPSSYSDDKTNADSLAAMGSIVQSAVHSPQPPPEAAKAQTLLVPVFKRLRDAYGDDLRLLKQKPVDSAGRQRVCDISISLYRNVESLPNGDAGIVLRYLLSDQTSTTEARSSRR